MMFVFATSNNYSVGMLLWAVRFVTLGLDQRDGVLPAAVKMVTDLTPHRFDDEMCLQRAASDTPLKATNTSPPDGKHEEVDCPGGCVVMV